jgi:hypothetical protein
MLRTGPGQLSPHPVGVPLRAGLPAYLHRGGRSVLWLGPRKGHPQLLGPHKASSPRSKDAKLPRCQSSPNGRGPGPPADSGADGRPQDLVTSGTSTPNAGNDWWVACCWGTCVASLSTPVRCLVLCTTMLELSDNPPCMSRASRRRQYGTQHTLLDESHRCMLGPAQLHCMLIAQTPWEGELGMLLPGAQWWTSGSTPLTRPSRTSSRGRPHSCPGAGSGNGGSWGSASRTSTSAGGKHAPGYTPCSGTCWASMESAGVNFKIPNLYGFLASGAGASAQSPHELCYLDNF